MGSEDANGSAWDVLNDSNVGAAGLNWQREQVLELRRIYMLVWAGLAVAFLIWALVTVGGSLLFVISGSYVLNAISQSDTMPVVISIAGLEFLPTSTVYTTGGALLIVIGLIGLITVVAVVSYVRELPRGRGTVAGWAAWDAPKSQSARDRMSAYVAPLCR